MPKRTLPLMGAGGVGRRDLIRLIGGAATMLAMQPGCNSDRGQSLAFSDDERSALATFADVIIPPDDEPGGVALGAVVYIERLVTAFDDLSVTPPIFAGGPFSGRQPLPDASGHASQDFPPHDFATFIELDRVNEAAWRKKLLAIKDQLKKGLQAAIASSDPPLAQQSPDDQLATFNAQPADFKDLMIELVTEAAFCAPEYGGNVDLAGWKMVHFEGDSQPLGYSQWDGKTHVERPESPLSTANPGADPAPIQPDVDALLKLVIAFLGGRSV